MVTIAPLSTIDPKFIEALLDRAFGPDRRTRTAYAVRGKAQVLPALSFAALDGGALIGSVQCWPVLHSGDNGVATRLVMVGPVAVAPERQRDGIGRVLMDAALGAATAERLDQHLILIGDPGYYQRFFGFTAERTGAWRLPGPVERHRLLARGDAVPAEPGELGPV